MKKDGLILLVVLAFILVFLLSLSFIAAQDAKDPKVEKAYSCLEDKVKDKCDSLSVEEQAFTVLAIGKCSSELTEKGKDNECWPSSGCKLRDTALAILAFDRTGKSTDKAETYLLAQKKIPADLSWYLEIDAEGETTCKISYSGTEKEIKISEDKKINKGAGNCLKLAQDNYWLKVDEGCYEVNFTISCDKDFKTTLLYNKKNSPTVYVSSKTNTASSGGKTEEKVNSFCFSTGNTCDYEGSLWTTYALAKKGKDISQFLPYLIAMADENEKYFPSAFLYMITDYDDYFAQIVNEQKNDYWKISNSPYNQFYDTSLALLALYGTNAEQKESAKTYLLEVQDDKGCWNDNIRDTAFILYAAWPKSVSPINGGGIDECEDSKYYCVSSLECEEEDKLDNFVCYGGDICCKQEAKEKTCAEKDGIICREDQECSGSWIPASDTSVTTKCCLGNSCIEPQPIKSECEEANYVCRTSCLDDEEEKVYECGEEKTCCAPAPQPSPSYWWVWLLIILIILVVLGIIFRNQLRVWLFKIKSKFRKGPAPSPALAGPSPRFPPTPPGLQRPMARPRMILPKQFQPPPGQARAMPQTKTISKTDKELEETLKKLKEMSK